LPGGDSLEVVQDPELRVLNREGPPIGSLECGVRQEERGAIVPDRAAVLKDIDVHNPGLQPRCPGQGDEQLGGLLAGKPGLGSPELASA